MPKVYSPGAAVRSDYYHYCDQCEIDDGREVITWYADNNIGLFALCHSCLSKTYFQFVSEIDKSGESIIVKRMPIKEELRNYIFDRDSRKCTNCGSTEDLCLDHIIAFSKGGKTSSENLQTLCRSCNSKKRDK